MTKHIDDLEIEIKQKYIDAVHLHKQLQETYEQISRLMGEHARLSAKYLDEETRLVPPVYPCIKQAGGSPIIGAGL